MIEFISKLLFNLLITLFIVRFIYYKSTKDNAYFFTYLVIGQVVFLLCYLLKNIELELGFVLGLFAIFGIIRYRTNSINIKEMTYLFSIIGLAMINSLSGTNFYIELIASNIIILVLIWCLEYYLGKYKKYSATLVTLTNLEELSLTNRTKLMDELEGKLNMKIEKINVKKINYLTDSVEILIYHVNNEN
ncbi:conserved membrane protein of unknown function [Tenacibaculum sp. 190130A14a]|uniref:DUF4956 domain-containing protein n=1 Tax=Tenacibaculum polynesiense TaxID=3137857 RepID=A0ABP1F401_9FLAO